MTTTKSKSAPETNEKVLRRMIEETGRALAKAAVAGEDYSALEAKSAELHALYERYHGRYVWDRFGRPPVRWPGT